MYSNPFSLRHLHADFVADGGRDPALTLQVVPRHVVLLRADEGEDVLLAAILADEGRRQPQATARLQLRRDAEDGRRAAGGLRRR